jgi:cysteine-S-conjugate beta-lyase
MIMTPAGFNEKKAYNLDQIIDRSGTNSMKWEFMSEAEPLANSRTLPFWVADMDFACAEPIIKAMHERVDRLIFGYSSSHTDDRYFRAVRGWYQRRFDWLINSEDIVYSPGVVPAVGFIIDLLTEPGDGVILQRPVYFPFSVMIFTRNRVIINNELLDRDGYYEMDLADLELKAADPKNKLMILCSPHNPVGRVWTDSELKKVVDICKRHQVTIISDEIHCDLVRIGVQHSPLAKLCPEYRDKIITTTSASKTFNMAGMQLANIIIHDKELRDRWQDMVRGRLSLRDPNPLSIVATQAAFESGEPWLEAVLTYIDDNMRFIAQFLETNLHAAKFRIPEGTYLAWINLGCYGLNAKELGELLIKKANVLIEGGMMFGDHSPQYIRINAACPRSLLQTGLAKIAKAIHAAIGREDKSA